MRLYLTIKFSWKQQLSTFVQKWLTQTFITREFPIRMTNDSLISLQSLEFILTTSQERHWNTTHFCLRQNH